jgi:hypothetical protein
MTEIFNGMSCKAAYLAEKKWMVFIFDGIPNIDEAKTMYVQVLEFMKTHKTIAFINDLKKLKGTFTKLNSWVVEQMKPAIQMGLKYDAMIVNEDIFTSFAIDDLMKKVSVLEIQLFQNMEDAEKWLDEKSQN